MSTRPKPILEIKGLAIQREGNRILDGISWRIERGQHWVILGANGSGKTSLLSALTGYFIPTDGEITVLGRKFGQSDWRDLRRHIGFVSSSIRQLMADDEPALETVISGKYAMIDYWGRIRPADRSRGLKLLRQVECGYLERRPWLYLSQGERQRVLIGRALMAKPRLLILDEPCAGLDPVAREHFLQFLDRLGSQKRAPALVLVTHHVEEIVPAITHALILKSGRVLAAGEKKPVLTPARLTAAFGTPIRLGHKSGRYSLRVARGSRRVV